MFLKKRLEVLERHVLGSFCGIEDGRICRSRDSLKDDIISVWSALDRCRIRQNKEYLELSKELTQVKEQLAKTTAMLNEVIDHVYGDNK